jgi:hypothetical protein
MIMKNKVFMASLGLVLLFALSFAACKHDSDITTKFEGRWGATGGGDTYTYIFSGNNFTFLKNNVNVYKGTFSYDDTMLFLNVTHEWNTGTWVLFGAQALPEPYSLNGDTLILNTTNIYTRQ